MLILVGCAGPAQHKRTSVPVQPVRLVITGPEGQRFTGNYVADGITNTVTGTVPMTLTLQARDVAYEFKHEGGDGEFRVTSFVGDLPRTSLTSGTGESVRGWVRESSWGGL